jgi:hypothetical protein
MITLERLDELQHETGAPVTRDELIELVLAHRLSQRVGRTLAGHQRRLECLIRDLDSALGAPEPPSLVAAEPFVDAVFAEAEIEPPLGGLTGSQSQSQSLEGATR